MVRSSYLGSLLCSSPRGLPLWVSSRPRGPRSEWPYVVNTDGASDGPGSSRQCCNLKRRARETARQCGITFDSGLTGGKEILLADERGAPSCGKSTRKVCVAPMMDWTDYHCRYFVPLIHTASASLPAQHSPGSRCLVSHQQCPRSIREECLRMCWHTLQLSNLQRPRAKTKARLEGAVVEVVGGSHWPARDTPRSRPRISSVSADRLRCCGRAEGAGETVADERMK
jgi:hypothetical protein